MAASSTFHSASSVTSKASLYRSIMRWRNCAGSLPWAASLPALMPKAATQIAATNTVFSFFIVFCLRVWLRYMLLRRKYVCLRTLIMLIQATVVPSAQSKFSAAKAPVFQGVRGCGAQKLLGREVESAQILRGEGICLKMIPFCTFLKSSGVLSSVWKLLYHC